MRILISNDDGVYAEGLKVLQKELSKLGEVWVVAPLQEQSTTGHSLTLHKPLRLIELGHRFYGVNGSPADCILLGIRQLLKGKEPDWVVSGINRGANLGQDVFYSGTVSAAREACIMGVPSLAVSLALGQPQRTSQNEKKHHYSTAAKLTARLIKRLPTKNFPKRTLLNLNVPDLALTRVKGLEFAHQGFCYYSGKILKRRDHRGKDYFWVGGKFKGFERLKGSDGMLVQSGFASVTPLKLDTTDYDFFAQMKEIEDL